MANSIPPGSTGANQLSPLYVDGMPLAELNTALRLEKQYLAGNRHQPSQRFWSSARRTNGVPEREVFEVDLNTDHITNAISFELAHFPQKCEVQYWDRVAQAWDAVPNRYGEPTQIVIRDSHPSKIPNHPPAGQHPFHFGPKHWVEYDLAVQPVESSRFRLVFSRQSGGIGPVRPDGTELAYPLGVRNFLVGYKVRDKNDVPRTRDSLTVLTERDYFASTTDMLGSPVQFHFRENRPTDLLRGGRWKSEPMPIPHAVIPFYVDARDASGNAQLVERFYVEPMYPGCSVNIYSSNDTPDSDYDANDSPLPFSAVQVQGAASPSQYGLDFVNAPSQILVSNEYLQWNPASDWWMGFALTRHADQSATIFHIEDYSISLTYDAGSKHWVFTTPAGTVTLTDPATSTGGSPPAVDVVFISKDTQITMNVNGVSASNAVMPSPAMPGQVIVGDLADAQNFLLRSLVLKTSALTPGDVDAFTTSPYGYVLKPVLRDAPSPNTDNSLLRFSPQFLTDVRYDNSTSTAVVAGMNPSGLVGGPGDIYDDLVWTPINRDYQLRRGEYYLPPTKAKFFKFEFTNLSAQTYETYVPINRTVKTFTSDVVQRNRLLHTSPNYTVAYGGAKTSATLNTILRYSDSLSLPPSIDTGADYSPTETFFHEDPNTVERLRAKNPYLGFVNWRGPFRPPRHVTIDRHTYEEIDVRHASKVAYFVGLNALKMYRVDYTVDDDTDRYLDVFHDQENLSLNEWDFNPGDMSTPADGVWQIVSKVFNSHRQVRAVQFATEQSDPIQLLSDSDFADTTLANWRAMGDALPLTISDAYNTDIGTAVLVQRSGSYNPLAGVHVTTPPPVTTTTDLTFGQMTQVFGTWDSAEIAAGGSTLFSYFEAFTTTDIPPPVVTDDGQPYVPGGIASTQAITPSGSGRVSAACRVIAPVTLHDRLYLQIIPAGDPETEIVLAEIAFDATPGSLIEHHVGFTVPDGFNGALTARLLQKAETGDAWFVDNISLYEDAITWEFSRDGGQTFYEVVDIRNDAQGVFVFPALPSGDTTGGTQLVYRVTGYRENLHLSAVCIRPWYVGLLAGIPHREELHAGGPNISMQDHYMKIEDDPYFHMWHKPIPIDWWYFFKRFLLAQKVQQVSLPVVSHAAVFISDDLVVFPMVDFAHDDWLVF
jgi:hypothetical protein